MWERVLDERGVLNTSSEKRSARECRRYRKFVATDCNRALPTVTERYRLCRAEHVGGRGGPNASNYISVYSLGSDGLELGDCPLLEWSYPYRYPYRYRYRYP